MNIYRVAQEWSIVVCVLCDDFFFVKSTNYFQVSVDRGSDKENRFTIGTSFATDERRKRMRDERIRFGCVVVVCGN